MLKYSIVIPAYKDKELLKNTLQKLNNQKYFIEEEYEVIVVDDGSDNDMYSFIKGVNKNYELNYIYLERNENSCRARTRNYGWKAAKAQFVVFLDLDILIQNSYLKELSRYFDYNPDIMVVGTRFLLPPQITSVNEDNEESLKKFFYYNRECLEFRHDVFNRFSYNAASYRCPWLLTFSCNMAIPKKWLELVGGFDEEFKYWGTEDVELGYKLHKANLKIVFNSKIEVFHQYHNQHDRKKDEIPVSMYEGVDGNTSIFLKKHSTTCEDVGLDEKDVYSLFKGMIDFNHNFEQVDRVDVLNFYEIERLDEIKKEILEISNRLGSEIIVNDYIENTDLDIWIQLLGKNGEHVRYVPYSKRLGK